jgi:hypothetical protein
VAYLKILQLHLNEEERLRKHTENLSIARNLPYIRIGYPPPPPSSRDSSVGIALSYRLDDRGSRVRVSAGAGNFSLHHRVQNGLGTQPASSPVGANQGLFPWG